MFRDVPECSMFLVLSTAPHITHVYIQYVQLYLRACLHGGRVPLLTGLPGWKG